MVEQGESPRCIEVSNYVCGIDAIDITVRSKEAAATFCLLGGLDGHVLIAWSDAYLGTSDSSGLGGSRRDS